jgi:hypothetical protein
MAAALDTRVQRLRAIFARLRQAHGLPTERPYAGKGEPQARATYAKNLAVHRKALTKARRIRPFQEATRGAAFRLGVQKSLADITTRMTNRRNAQTRHAIHRSLGDYGG